MCTHNKADWVPEDDEVMEVDPEGFPEEDKDYDPDTESRHK